VNEDLLCEAHWCCAAVMPGAAQSEALAYFDAEVPGTAAGAVRSAGGEVMDWDYDAHDWWYRTTFDASPDTGPVRLLAEGLATVADVWLNGEHVLHSENMFVRHDVALPSLAAENELVIRFAALTPVLALRRPRPRWKVARLVSQNLRWLRTSLLGRLNGWTPTPAPVGPWRGVQIVLAGQPRVVDARISSTYVAATSYGSIEVDLEIVGVQSVVLRVGSMRVALTRGLGDRFTGVMMLHGVEAWWPHTHGTQTLYDVELECDAVVLHLARVGFRTVDVDRSDDGFRVRVNGIEVFCRGASWMPLDAVSLQSDAVALRAGLELVRGANMNMIRLGGETVYPEQALLALCDELGILVWQDCMIAFVDLPEDPGFLTSLHTELRQHLSALQGHPCIAVVSGGSEVEQQAAYQGQGSDRNGFLRSAAAELVSDLLPGIAYLPSTPTGGVIATDPRSGVSHYYGVGAYRRPVEDARRADVRFAAECLAFATPPERVTVDAAFHGASAAGHHPRWKAAVYRDAHASWDIEDVRDHYVRHHFGLEPGEVRFRDPERALDLGRAVVADLVATTLSEWRRPGSSCAGAIVFHHNDLVPGAGLGLVDALGRPKAPWYAMRRTMAPVAVVITDEGLNGIDAHVLNDSSAAVCARLQVELFANGEARVEVASHPVMLAPHAGGTVPLSGLFQGFRDLNNAHGFGPPAFDAILVSLIEDSGAVLHQTTYTPDPRPRAVEMDLGLSATLVRAAEGWLLELRTRRLAQWVSIECASAIPSDSWFHLAPGASRVVGLGVAELPPRGRVHALNAAYSVPFSQAHRQAPDSQAPDSQAPHSLTSASTGSAGMASAGTAPAG
jgi:beta-mannosidase